jgi:hypothetical protein
MVHKLSAFVATLMEAYFKVGKSPNQTVLERELIEFHADTADITVKSQPQTIQFQISGVCGDALIDGRQSFFSLHLKTNTYTAFLSGDITSIIKKITLKLLSHQLYPTLTRC